MRLTYIGGMEGHRNPKPDEFDEDISDFEGPGKKDENENEGYCDCDSDVSECECEPSIDDHVSERSYTDDDADYYYELKEKREERKRELRDLKRQEASMKQEERDYNEGKVNEVLEAYKTLKKAIRNGDEPPSLDPLAIIERFRLFSVEHVDYCCNGDFYPTRHVSFYYFTDLSKEGNGKRSTDGKPKPLLGHVHLDANTRCNLDAFSPPTKAGREKHRMTANKGKLKLDVRFLSNDYLIISIPATVVFGSKPIPPSAPKKFKFAGIRYTLEMTMKEPEARRKRKRSPSSDDELEFYHPSGYW
ncbi:unnamed protein product [Clonostachys byssicola]|uniref:Uncharacterized protein n=1 Tax=Clonostachys byssicola TaxID=160290 RepID=A0A9N9U5L0_9HYPO|nr:unnamed protein product [Clonostachys byssicola]